MRAKPDRRSLGSLRLRAPICRHVSGLPLGRVDAVSDLAHRLTNSGALTIDPALSPSGYQNCQRSLPNRMVIDSFPSQSRLAASMGHESGGTSQLVSF